MEKEDARSLKPGLQKEKRKIALRIRMNGHTYSEIAAAVGVHVRTVQFWWQRYGSEGLKAAVYGGKRSVAIGERRTLSGSQENKIQSLITGKMPDQYKLAFALWAVHHSNKVRDWLAKHKESIELLFLPAYSPELNPDECLYCDLKAQVHGSKPARNRGELE